MISKSVADFLHGELPDLKDALWERLEIAPIHARDESFLKATLTLKVVYRPCRPIDILDAQV